MTRRRNDSGVTMIEVAVASALMVLACISMGFVFNSSMQANKRVNQLDGPLTQSRLTLDTMARELRSRGSVVFVAGTNQAQPNPGRLALRFTTIADPDASLGSHTIEYTVQNGSLMRSRDSGRPVVVVSGIRNDDAHPIFGYFDANGRDLLASGIQNAIPASARLITIDLIVSVTSGPPLLLHADVTFRSLS
jgi:Tfp pilus assembly protein PilV